MTESAITLVHPNTDMVHIAVVRRALNDSAAIGLVAEVTQAADAQPDVPVVLDLKKVEFVPSAVLGALVRLSQSLKLAGRKLILVHVDRRVRGTLSVTRLEKVLDLRETIDDVLG
ncbi:MAG: STAS domain-containing protein [Planctomycetes bacterium]|nr:STAS domain-containing protein [Planctomycetota bacterium]